VPFDPHLAHLGRYRWRLRVHEVGRLPMTADDDDAGDFSTWVAEVRPAIRGERGIDVPCGSCTACCRSSQFVAIEPNEADTLAHIPEQLLFPAPQARRGVMVLGYDERGHCPMLVDDACSIYDHRPRACRTYDCRVFAAAGVIPEDKPDIARQVRGWRFGFGSAADRTRSDAVRAAAAFLADRPEVAPAGAGRVDASRRALMALEIHELFLQREEESGDLTVVRPDANVVRAALAHPR
jgi:Fe-S-cluster containining protein